MKRQPKTQVHISPFVTVLEAFLLPAIQAILIMTKYYKLLISVTCTVTAGKVLCVNGKKN